MKNKIEGHAASIGKEGTGIDLGIDFVKMVETIGEGEGRDERGKRDEP